jgi:hypothetical protein
MTPETIASNLKLLEQEARDWDNTTYPDRIRAMEYYDGVMRDVPTKPGFSSVVSPDFRAACKKVLPSISRTILRGEKIAEYQPVGESDVESAAQATDYVNHVVVPESSALNACHDAINDALRVENGILKWWYDDSVDVEVSHHTGLDEQEFVTLASDPEAEVLEYSQEPPTSIETPPSISCKIRRKVKKNLVRLSCIPREQFRIDPDALTIEDATFVCHYQRLRRHQLIAMGYDRAKVDELPSTAQDTESETEETTRRDRVKTRRSEIVKGHEEIDYYECYVRVDEDDDGLAELRRIIMAGGFDEDKILEDVEVDEIPFADIVIERRPHEWRGRALFHDMENVQRIKTVLLRATLDNLYMQNSPQPIFSSNAVENPDALFNPGQGKPIMVKPGVDVRAAVGDRVIPFTADKSYGMLEYMDQLATDLTGISDGSAGLPPDALQNVTAKASAMLEQVGIGSIEEVAARVSEGIKRAFKGILKLVIQHQDKPRTVRLRDQWVQVDPRSWNANMDCTVNTGLGAGTRERDMAAVMTIIGLQEKLLASFGADDNPYVTADNLFNAIADAVKATGMKVVSRYFTKPDPQAIQQKLEAQKNQPNPEQIKLEAQKELEQAKLQVQVSREEAQMQADLKTKEADAERGMIEITAKLEADLTMERERVAFEREKFQAELALKQAELELKRQSLMAQMVSKAVQDQGSEPANMVERG